MSLQTVVPRMVVRDLVAAVAFLRSVFGATGEVESGYGDRRAMVHDPFGNVFQIAHRRG
ncbi:hypothetical protein SAMN05421837_106420 [Amycolatopsis pretoriensis]|uniref:Glyoxalase/Bleomycin resistance protein/Dioxygenase superfamily protein n=1 Tax=Amycolatopsis pretoriensis TaxID=218821 RepID=A0A1H5R3Z4_9PSEU|nr:hypothetical protein [Amycolatopsis pretoriensis]SEF32774.1 hypothetical protein SAMN05421837_106420 [Amycolatopsis pretoriensis]